MDDLSKRDGGAAGVPSLLPSDGRSPFRRFLPLALTLGTGLIVSVILFSMVRGWERKHQQAEFERRANIPQTALQRDIDDHLYLLRSIGAFYLSSHRVDRREFRGFTKDALARLTGIQAVEWIPRVADAHRTAHEATARSDVNPQFQIVELNAEGGVVRAAQRDEYFPISYVEPSMRETVSTPGLDLGSISHCDQAMRRARDFGEPVASERMPLRQSGGESPACRVFIAIYTNGAAHATPEQRLINLGGYAAVVLSPRDLVEASLKGVGMGDIAYQIHDVTDAAAKTLLFQSPAWPAEPTTGIEVPMTLSLAGRAWLLLCRPTPAYLAHTRTGQGWWVLAGGLLISAILGAYLFSALGRSSQIERLVVDRTTALARANQELKDEISQRNRIQQALAQERYLIDALMDTMPDHIYFKDRQSRFIRVNKAMASQFQLGDPAEAVGKSDFDFFTSEHAQRAFEDEQQIIRTGVPVVGREERETWPNGSVTWVSTTKEGLRERSGRIIGTFGMSRDITAAKRAEEALARKAQELARSNTDLEQFAYVASHDLQEPLRMIASYTQLLARRYKDQLDGDAEEFIGYAVDGATRMQVLINDLLAFSRVGTRGKPFAWTDCAEVLGRVEANLKIAIEGSQAAIRHTPLPKVMADATQLTQLFQNLLSNSIKFHGENPPEIFISAELQSPAESVACDKAPAEWLFAVRDNGIGVEPQYFERIFVIFQRLHTREHSPGTGIGLAMCKKIVERHGGRIWLESSPGAGSTFYFTLPQPEGIPHE